MSGIKILVAAHREAYIPDNRFLFPIQVGAALSENRLPHMLHDDEGIHISDKNKSYCELTAQYWAWKNLEADCYGFFHYRRYMSFAKVYPASKTSSGGIRCRTPYVEADAPDGDLSSLALDERLSAAAEAYDVITVLSEHMDVTAYEQFCQFHAKADLDRAIAILKRCHPKQAKACDTYMGSKHIYFCNMYLMKREYFTRYMEWLFPILEEFEKEKDFSHCSEKEMRVTGYIAERLFGVYYTWLKQEGQAVCGEVQYVIFHRNVRQFRLGKANRKVSIDMRKVNRLLPAGSFQRRVVRRLLKKAL